ncbi:hypothetical protein QBC46DRAFT_396583 [Diplogelasinospora grovesii]|uniref:Transmembrane protein n=1 Tax=Diplogelasinospora grovesii TaxID=303347 RepID=A0AAN6MYF3_9PEZI|nr:hypothetical protein QBC46DRAFT_396583 [Diplogelasinospora grovesii]
MLEVLYSREHQSCLTSVSQGEEATRTPLTEEQQRPKFTQPCLTERERRANPSRTFPLLFVTMTSGVGFLFFFRSRSYITGAPATLAAERQSCLTDKDPSRTSCLSVSLFLLSLAEVFVYIGLRGTERGVSAGVWKLFNLDKERISQSKRVTSERG